MNRILIYDDVPDFKGKLRKHLESLEIVAKAFEVDTLSEEDLESSMQIIEERQAAFRETGTWDGTSIPLDDTSIFIVDYDLFEAKPFLTGENLAYLVRCFSTCVAIVGVNHYGANTFDLTLRGHPESFADLNVGEVQLNNPNLWGQPMSGFHPWCWPVLPDYVSNFHKKVADVRNSLGEDTKADVPICQVLGVHPRVFDTLPRSIGQFLGGKPSETTFRQFVLESENGLRRRDKPVGEVDSDIVARIGAARLSKWLERLVLPEQDILVDAPHLVSRYPSLMTGDVMDIVTWNRTARLVSHDALELSTEPLERFRLKMAHWLSRSVWLWDELRECEDILEVREPWKLQRPAWVFCEDASEFYKESYREFRAEVESPFARRFVKQFDGVDYRPVYRLSL